MKLLMEPELPGTLNLDANYPKSVRESRFCSSQAVLSSGTRTPQKGLQGNYQVLRLGHVDIRISQWLGVQLAFMEHVDHQQLWKLLPYLAQNFGSKRLFESVVDEQGDARDIV